MDSNPPLRTDDLLTLLEIPRDGRVLTFGLPSALYGLEIAARRPDTLIVVCDTESVTTTQLVDRAGDEQLNNLVVGDTPAGPLVDRVLCVDSLSAIEPGHLITVRTAMLPGGYAIFVESAAPDAAPLVAKLKELGYEVADELAGALAGATVIRAR
jgi:hypothetical protein